MDHRRWSDTRTTWNDNAWKDGYASPASVTTAESERWSPESSSLDIGSHSVDVDDLYWADNAFKLFSYDGFVIVNGALTLLESDEMHRACKDAAADIVGSDRAGNRGPGRYSFGVASSTGSMLHVPAFACCLLDSAGSRLEPLLRRIFDAGQKRDYLCVSSGGDFVVGDVPMDQSLHSDLVVKRELDVWLPPPMLSVNFAVHDITKRNGPMRIIPRTQLHRGILPEKPPARWANSCICPLRAGAAIVRDVRVLHSGTANLLETTRFLPNVEYVSADFRATNRNDCFPPVRCLPQSLYNTLKPETQRLSTEIVHLDGAEQKATFVRRWKKKNKECSAGGK